MNESQISRLKQAAKMMREAGQILLEVDLEQKKEFLAKQNIFVLETKK